ncbi:hypothetical protein I3I95_10535 [bacterium]|nr:hypothetical protein [bacterium]
MGRGFGLKPGTGNAARLLWRQSISVALAYVGVIVGAGLSSGQDILQYFLSFGRVGILGVVAMGVLNVVFGRIMVTLGSYYQAESHEQVFSEITRPVIGRVIDVILVVASFVMGFVMIAGAGANLQQQFGIPSWAGALACALLIVAVSFLDFGRITRILGVFTPVIIVMILLITAYAVASGPHDVDALEAAARTIEPAIPSLWLSVLNYFALCALTGVSMAFVLGGSIVRIGVAQRGGTIGGVLIGLIVTCAAVALYLNLPSVKDADIPMLSIVAGISPVLAVVYAVVISALIFNTAFSLFYATARRFAGGSDRRLRAVMAGVVAAGFVCSFGGFKSLVGVMYPVLGYLGIVLLVVLAVAWVRERAGIMREMLLRRSMIRLLLKRHDVRRDFTPSDTAAFERLSDASVVETQAIRQTMDAYAREAAQRRSDIVTEQDVRGDGREGGR